MNNYFKGVKYGVYFEKDSRRYCIDKLRQKGIVTINYKQLEDIKTSILSKYYKKLYKTKFEKDYSEFLVRLTKGYI